MTELRLQRLAVPDATLSARDDREAAGRHERLDGRRATRMLIGDMCPHCGRDAPILYRGAVPYCTACGGLRAPLSSPSFNLAGKPAKVGGAVANVVGWLVLLVGLSMSLGLGLLLYALSTIGIAIAFALPIAVVALVVGAFIVRGGVSLRRSGAKTERTTRDQAMLELAGHRGAVTALEASRALGVGVAAADAMLTDLAKREPERIAVDVDDQGVVRYRLAQLDLAAFDGRVRVGPDAGAPQSTTETQEKEDEAENASERAGLRR